MKKIFLTSDLDCSVKVDGVRQSQKMNNANGVVDQIKSVLLGKNKMVVLASNPNEFDKNDYYATFIFESFKKSGIGFKKNILIDNRFKENIEETIKTADLVFLSGGKTEVQMKFFEKINLKNILKEYQGVIIGQSAGAINLADEALCPPEEEEEIGKNYKWKGLGKTNINIEPHFTLNVEDELGIKLREELLKMSVDQKIYGICDGSHIFVNDESAKLYGEAFVIENGKIDKVNDNMMELDVTISQDNLRKKN